VITSIGISHGVRQTSETSILEGKMQLFEKLEPRATVVLPSASPAYQAMLARARATRRIRRVISCGGLPGDDVKLIEARHRPGSSDVTIEAEGRRHSYVVGQPGAHFVQNSLLAAGVLQALGVPLSLMLTLARFVPTGRRVERFRVALPSGALELIDDSYNAAPDSVRALLEVVGNRKGARRRVLILGDMRELGRAERELHLGLAPDIVRAGVDFLVTVGPLSRGIAHALAGRIPSASFDDAAEAAAEIDAIVRPFDLVAVKGSNAMNMLAIVNKLRRGEPLPRQDMSWSIETESPRRV
jgi:UDP-N-acetylmuramoyl-tripeptide--D-alanyl-D-alanine ligase